MAAVRSRIAREERQARPRIESVVRNRAGKVAGMGEMNGCGEEQGAVPLEAVPGRRGRGVAAERGKVERGMRRVSPGPLSMD